MNNSQRTSEVLADLTLSVGYDGLPREVIAKANELILDSIACIIGGSRPEQGEKTIRLFSAMGGVPDVHIFGTHERVPLLNGIYVNSYLATVLDFDDTYDGHPGSTLVPVALSIGELNRVSGKTFLEAVVAGYETGIRVSNGIKPTAARKVELIEWKEASDAYPLVKRELMSRAEIVTADAGIHEKTIRIPMGDPRSPMSWEELETKFHHTVDPILGADQAQKICAVVQTIENCADLSEFSRLLVP